MRIIFINPAAEKLFGLEKDTAIGQNLEILVPDGFKQVHKHHILKVPIKLDDFAHSPYKQSPIFSQGQHKDGHLIPLEVSVNLHEQNGHPFFICLLRDLSPEVQVQNALTIISENEQRYLGMIESQKTMLMRVNHEGRFVFANQAFCQMFGKTLDELVGTLFSPTIHPDDFSETIAALEKLHKPPYCADLNVRNLTVFGWRWIAWEHCVIQDPTRDFFELQSVGHDITAQFEAQERLKDSESRYHAIVDAVPDMIFRLNRADILLDSHVTETSKLYQSADAFLNQEITILLPPKVAAQTMAAIATVLESKQISAFEYQIPILGATSHFEIRIAPLSNEEVLAVIRDVTERKKSEEDLRKSETRFRELFENSPVAYFSLNESYHVIDFNSRFCDILGERAENILGKPFESFLPKDIRSIFATQFSQFIHSGEIHADLQFLRSDDMPLEILLEGQVQYDQNHAFRQAHCIAFNITDRRRIEEALHESEEMYRLIAENVSDVIWIVDASEARFRYISPSVEQLRGYTAKEVMAQNYAQSLTPSSYRNIQQKQTERYKAFTQGQTSFYVDQIEQPCKDGTTVWTEVTSNFQINKTNGHVEIYGISRNITERRRNDTLMQTRLELMEIAGPHPLISFVRLALDKIVSLLDGSSGFFYILEPDHVTCSICIRCTDEFAEIADIPDADQEKEGVWQTAAREHKPITRSEPVFHVEDPAVSSSSPTFIREIAVPVIRDDKVLAVLSVNGKSSDFSPSDIEAAAFLADVIWESAQRKQTEKDLLESEERYRSIIESSKMGVVLHRNHRFIFTNQAFSEMCGFTKEEMAKITVKEAISFLHVDDRAAEYQRFMRRIAGETVPAQAQIRLIHKNGQTVWVNSTVQTITYQGRSTVLVLLQDITEQIYAELALKESEARLQLLGGNLTGAMMFVYSMGPNGSTRFEYISAGLEELTGIRVENAMLDSTLLDKTILPQFIPLIQAEGARSAQYLTPFEVEFQRKHAKTGEIRWEFSRSSPRKRSDGTIVWYGIQIDITDRKRTEQKLRDVNEQLRNRVTEIMLLRDELHEQALHDPLTGLHNRRYLTEELTRELARVRRENIPMSFIAIDLDRFKTINDTYGHAVGDLFLNKVAALLRTNSRTSDIICRYGGDEFLLVLPGANSEAALKRAQEILRKALNTSVIHNHKSLNITLSLGIATYPDHGSETDEVIRKADQALYISKNNGRNQVSVFPGD